MIGEETRAEERRGEERRGRREEGDNPPNGFSFASADSGS